MPALKIVTFYALCIIAIALSVQEKATASEKTLRISYPYVQTDPVYKDISDYIHDLLKLLLSKSGNPYVVEPVYVPPVPMSRTVMYLNSGKFNVAWAHYDSHLDELLLPIPVPIFRGLGGWRLFFVRADDTRMAEVKDLAALKRFQLGQGHDWPDTTILRSAGFEVRTGVARDNLFQLLKHQRIDAFPRSVMEIWSEAKLPQASGLRVDEHVVLHYPTAFYLVLKRSDRELSEILQTSFDKAIADGSFQQLFRAWKGDIFELSRLNQRQVISIDNPILGANARLDRHDLWFTPADLTRAESDVPR
ncbi:hypothetical protein [Teredinibacter turnerae]|uniref:hypothetical protein n=1 Tax=Teredinibacter turnerae TaxID=2426 RepID=UPI0003A51EC8|nr:hypothetical protein [Teredinibacter turnerae]